jgi:protein gp37
LFSKFYYKQGSFANFNWVIVDGESGPGARPVMQEWVTDIRDQCLGAKVPFFFKPWDGMHMYLLHLAGKRRERKSKPQGSYLCG